MSGRIAARLKELGIELPPPMPPAGNYVGMVRTGNLLYVAGVGPTWGPEPRFQGKVGRERSVEEGQEAARLTVLNLISLARNACDGDLDRVTRWVKLFGLVHCVPDFSEPQKVIDAGSAFLVDIFGEAGRHARAVVGSPGLPFGITVEIDAVVEIA